MRCFYYFSHFIRDVTVKPSLRCYMRVGLHDYNICVGDGDVDIL